MNFPLSLKELSGAGIIVDGGEDEGLAADPDGLSATARAAGGVPTAEVALSLCVPVTSGVAAALAG